MDTTTRRAEAQAALSALLQRYWDVFGPQCWCDGDCDTTPCPAIPPTVGLTAWVFVAEWGDLDPDGDASITVHTSRGCGASRAVGMMVRGQEVF